MQWLLGILLTLGVVQAGTAYRVVSLGGYNGTFSAATGIAANGRTAGSATTTTGMDVAFGGGQTLGTAAQASDINSAGTVIGTSYASGSPRATSWVRGVADEILGVDSYGLAINESGDIAGSRLSGGQMHAFIASDGSVTDLSVPGSWSAAYDINARGAATGYAMQSNGTFRAFVYNPVSGTGILGTLGGSDSYGQAISNSGAVAGTSTTGLGLLHAFFYDGYMRDLGTLGGSLSAAYDVNSSGQVVGYSLDRAGRSRAFVWLSGMMVDLNTLVDPDAGWTLDAAYGINDAGQIVGGGTYQGQATAFLLDPRIITSTNLFQPADVVDSAVPEPGWLMPLGLIFLALGSRRPWRQSTRDGSQ